jgi:hypothetical protein
MVMLRVVEEFRGSNNEHGNKGSDLVYFSFAMMGVALDDRPFALITTNPKTCPSVKKQTKGYGKTQYFATLQ